LANLATSFLDAGGQGPRSDVEALERRIGELCARGRAAYPSFELDDEAFAAHLGRCGAAVAESLEPLHAEDLYLAGACLSGDPRAVALLRETQQPVLARYLKRVGPSAPALEEVEQRLWDALFVGGPEGPKLATYSGRGPIGAWVGISAQRIALMMLRHDRAESRARSEIAARGRLADVDPELAAIKDRYRAEFQQAVDQAIAALDGRDKVLYRMHLVEGLTLERMAKAYGVSHPTIIRWLDRARNKVLDEVKRLLREALPVSTDEFDSIARLLVSQLDLDISRALSMSR
jgi:RNA polymerase sigma-70 factor (ECF subfamily)